MGRCSTAFAEAVESGGHTRGWLLPGVESTLGTPEVGMGAVLIGNVSPHGGIAPRGVLAEQAVLCSAWPLRHKAIGVFSAASRHGVPIFADQR